MPVSVDQARLYPARALDRGMAGEAVIIARINGAGRAEEVYLVSQNPSGWFFGEAAVLAAQNAQWPTTAADGAPAPYFARWRVRFRVE